MQQVTESLRNYLTFSMPNNSSEVKENQRIRHEGLMFLKGENLLQNGGVSRDAREAVQRFWATQNKDILRALTEQCNTHEGQAVAQPAKP